MIYFFILIILYYLAYVNNRKNKDVVFSVSMILMFIVLGLHNGQFANDYPQYLKFFRGANSIYGSVDSPGTYDLEWPYYYMCKFLRFFGNYDFVYILGCFIIFFVPILYLIRKYSSCAPLSILLLFVLIRTDLHLFIITAHRQMVANTFFMIAIVYFLNISKSNVRVRSKQLILLGIFFAIAVVAHSSSYFVLPLLLLAFVINIDNKKIYEGLLTVSFFTGIFISNFAYTIMSSVMLFLGDVKEIERTTFYLVNDVYDRGVANLQGLLPLTALTYCLVHFSNKNELNSIFSKSMIIATLIINIFYTVPLITRSMTTLLILGAVGGIPKIITKKSKARLYIFLIIALHILVACRQYTRPEFRILPFEFIWE